MNFNPHPYQQHAIQHIIENKAAGLFLDMGLGKTVSTLTAINILMYEHLEVNKVLIIAPKRVAEDTWAVEIDKWQHTKHLTISKVLGTEKQRKQALKAKADLYITNRENVSWLVGHVGIDAWDFDMLVVDESSSFKDHQSQRFKALKTVLPKIDRKVILTGTPAPNSLINLWPQLYILDRGQRLGETITKFRTNYCSAINKGSFIDYKLIGDKVQEVHNKIADICISMKAKDYLQLPERIDVDTPVHLSEQHMQQYLAFEREQVMQLQGVEVTAANAAVLTGKLLQCANGAVYDENKQIIHFHDEKLEALAERVEMLDGKPVLVFYQFKSDLVRLEAYFKKLKPKALGGSSDITDWNKGKIKMLLAHPASAGHGLNLQYGGHHIEWFGINWSLELYMQAVARLDRQGQEKAVVNSRLITVGTMDEDVLRALHRKSIGQEALLEAVKARIEKYTKM